MDPIEQINRKKDTSFAMMLAIQALGHRCFYLNDHDLNYSNGQAIANLREIHVTDQDDDYFNIIATQQLPLSEMDIVLMRKDPPVDQNYLHVTQLLDLVAEQGTLVANKPQALRDANEKIFLTQFSQCIPRTEITAKKADILEFLAKERKCVIKGLDSLGGRNVQLLETGDTQLNQIIDDMTQNQQQLVMLQQYLPEISEGDKRILMLHGKAVPFALARIPSDEDFHGNLAAGAKGVAIPLSERDQWIAKQVGPRLLEMGLSFVGLDVIGNYLTEINVTSPTCVRELDAQCDLHIALDYIKQLTE